MATVHPLASDEVEAFLEPLRALALRSKATWGYDEEFLEAFATTLPTSLDQPGRVTLVAEEDDVVVGFAIVDDRGDHAWLEDLWVEPALQRQGIGRRLVEEAAATSARLGVLRLEWESDPNAEPFYLALGARRIGVVRSTLDEGRALPVMRLDVS